MRPQLPRPVASRETGPAAVAPDRQGSAHVDPGNPDDEPAAGLAVDGLTRRFGRRVVVDHVTFTAAPGTTLGLLGPNGCGKSTTMKMLAGALTAHAGTFTLDGTAGGVDGLAVKARTGFIPDVGGLFPRLSGTEHLELTARLYGLHNWRARADDLLDALHLTEVADERAGGYSHGMSRKLSAAIALLPNPRLLLADEPFDGVDQTGIETLTGLFSDAASHGAVVLVTTHLLGVAENLCDHVHLMGSGTLRSHLSGRGLENLAATYTRVLGVDRDDIGHATATDPSPSPARP